VGNQVVDKPKKESRVACLGGVAGGGSGDGYLLARHHF